MMKDRAKEYGLYGFEVPQNIHLTSTEFSIENGMLTPTHKQRRLDIKAYFSEQIEALYAD